MEKRNAMDRLVEASDQVGVIGSPSSTSLLSLDILGDAVTRKLVGELALFRFLQDSVPHYALGQIAKIELRNVWHEDPTMRSLIRQRGRVDAVSGRQDTHIGQLAVSSVFREAGMRNYEASILGTIPATGTGVHVVTDEILDEILRPCRDQVFYLGRIYGSSPKLPLWFKHFDCGRDGAGEAYHLGIFGKTGSGKSVLAKMILLAYSRNPSMGLLVIDPQGEFSRDMRTGSPAEGFPLPIRDLTAKLGKQTAVLTVRNLVLDRWELFEQILYESPFFERLTVPQGENRQLAATVITEKIQKAGVTLTDLHLKKTFQQCWKELGDEKVQRVFYRSEPARSRFNATLREADSSRFYTEYWVPVAELFREDRPGARTVGKALAWLLDLSRTDRPILIVDLSKEQAGGLFWNERIQSLVLKRLLDGLGQAAEDCFKEGQSLNTLVVIDEAHRLAPRQAPGDDSAASLVREVLVDSARTTRKYGLGWLFISQSLSSLHPDILQQLRILFFGFGLGLGREFQSLKELVGFSGPALDLYQLFRDPHSAFDSASRQYSFMTIGPVSPLSFSGGPLFFNAFNTVAEFLVANGLADRKP